MRHHRQDLATEQLLIKLEASSHSPVKNRYGLTCIAIPSFWIAFNSDGDKLANLTCIMQVIIYN